MFEWSGVKFNNSKKYIFFLFLLSVFNIARGDNSPLDVHYRLDVELNTANSLLTGDCYITISNFDSADSIVLLLKPNRYKNINTKSFHSAEARIEEPPYMKIESVKVRSKSVKPIFINDSLIYLPTRYNQNKLEINIEYLLYIPNGTLTEIPVKEGDLYILNSFYPEIDINSLAGDKFKNRDFFCSFDVTFSVDSGYAVIGSSKIIKKHWNNSKVFMHFEKCREKYFTIILSSERKLITKHYPNIDVYILPLSKRKETVERIAELVKDFDSWVSTKVSGSRSCISISVHNLPDFISLPGVILIPHSELMKIKRGYLFSVESFIHSMAKQYISFETIKLGNELFTPGLELYLVKTYLKETGITYTPNIQEKIYRKLIGYIVSSLDKFHPQGNEIFITSTQNFLPITKEIAEIRTYESLKTIINLLGEDKFFGTLQEYNNLYGSKNIRGDIIHFVAANNPQISDTLITDLIYQKRRIDVSIQNLLSIKKNSHFLNSIEVKHNLGMSAPIKLKIYFKNNNTPLFITDTVNSPRDTIFISSKTPLRKVVIDPYKDYKDIDRRNNRFPKPVKLTPFFSLPEPEAYQIYFIPTFDFNKRDIARIGIKLRGAHWFDLRPFIPAEERNDWAIGVNFGLKSKSPGYDIAYSTNLKIIPGSPRIEMNARSYFDISEATVSTEYYIGDIRYLFFYKMQGYKKLKITLTTQKVKTLTFLDEKRWETGRYNFLNLQFINFHNWIYLRHMFVANFGFTPRFTNKDFNFLKYSFDIQVRYRLVGNIYALNRIFYGRINGTPPRQKLFYIFGKNNFENLSFSSFYQIKGSGDMRGYGKRNLSGQNILTSNMEFIYNLVLFKILDFDIVIFGDAGMVSQRTLNFKMENFLYDVGMGIRINLFENIKFGISSPFYVSHPPAGEKKLKPRFIITTDLKTR
ncbi:MAG: BamA/TamA family outer membrane protein [Candidatus Marinimicrobia bacterium]|nr:BamA/TamA family outer membrane protein [Candidatus Neomarinimicrobiota bacterium]